MQESLETRLNAIDEAIIAQLARSVLNSDAAAPVEWHFQAMRGGVGGGAFGTALYRLSGMARDQEEIVPWTLVLKVLQARPDDNPGYSLYWKRESETYQSGFLDDLPPCLAAPRCFGVTNFQESDWLWLEDVKDETARWPLKRYGVAAQHLGEFNAGYLAGRSLPSWSWLSADYLRDDIKTFGLEIHRLQESLGHPLMRRFVPRDAASALLRLWNEREAFLDALDGLPQTLCHFDAFRRNMFARRTEVGEQTVLIDWAFLGPGPIGAELTALVQASLIWNEIPVSRAPDLDRVAFDWYLKGLRMGGWRGDVEQVRLGFTAAIALRRMAMIGYMTSMILDPSRHAHIEHLMGLPIGEFGDHVNRVGAYVEKLASEARALMPGL